MTGRAVERAPEERVRLEDRLRGPVTAVQAQRSTIAGRPRERDEREVGPSGAPGIPGFRYGRARFTTWIDLSAYQVSPTPFPPYRGGCTPARCWWRPLRHDPTLIQIVRLTPERVPWKRARTRDGEAVMVPR